MTPSKKSVLIISVSDTYIFSANSWTEIGFDKKISVGFSLVDSSPAAFFRLNFLFFLALLPPCFFIVFASSSLLFIFFFNFNLLFGASVSSFFTIFLFFFSNFGLTGFSLSRPNLRMSSHGCLRIQCYTSWQF